MVPWRSGNIISFLNGHYLKLWSSVYPYWTSAPSSFFSSYGSVRYVRFQSLSLPLGNLIALTDGHRKVNAPLTGTAIGYIDTNPCWPLKLIIWVLGGIFFRELHASGISYIVCYLMLVSIVGLISAIVTQALYGHMWYRKPACPNTALIYSSNKFSEILFYDYLPGCWATTNASHIFYQWPMWWVWSMLKLIL